MRPGYRARQSDEPAASLGPLGQQDALEIMASLWEHATIFYSTHILDEMQRVSVRVVILKHGELIAQGSIDELLIGANGSVYPLMTKGDLEQVERWLGHQPWISSLQSTRVNGHVQWRVAVHDEKIAKQHLLRGILAQSGVTVLEFRRQRFELEKVFLNLVPGKLYLVRCRGE